jgi:ubiquitin-protein ligase E3 A
MQTVIALTHNSLTLPLLAGAPIPREGPLAIAEFLHLLRQSSHARLPSSAFVNEPFSTLFRPDSIPPELIAFPSILSLSLKNDWFHFILDAQQQNARYQAQNHLVMDLFMNGGAIPAQRFVEAGGFAVTVRRDRLLDDTMRFVDRANDSQLIRRLRVTFAGEEGIDAGGVTREFFHLIVAQLFSPDFGMFRIVADKFYWFVAPMLPDMVSELRSSYKMLGTVIALAVYNSVVLPIRFPLLFYRKLLGETVTLHDLAEVDAALVASLESLLAMPERGEDVADLELTFEIGAESFGTHVDVQLVPGGDQQPVTNENVEEYVSAYVEWFANTSVDTQFEKFRTGFGRVCKGELLKRFAPDELDILVSGEEVFEWELLERNAHYWNGYKAHSRAIRFFWEIFMEMPDTEKAKFLLFTTGSDRAPVGGLGKVVITIQKVTDTELFPVSHTCFSTLGLPNYRSKQEMSRKLRYAINETEGFGLE